MGERALYDTYEVDSFVDESEYQGMAPQEWETVWVQIEVLLQPFPFFFFLFN